MDPQDPTLVADPATIAAGDPNAANAPATEAPATPDYRTTFFERAKTEFGREFNDEDDLFSHVKGFQGEAEAYKGKASQFESRLNELPPAFIEASEFLKSKGFQGTEQELLQTTLDWMQVNATNYSDLAVKNPEAVLAAHLRSTNSALDATDISETIADKREAFEAQAAAKGLDGKEAEDFVHRKMSLEAKQFVPALESGKKSLRFTPTTVETAEQKAQKAKDADVSYLNSLGGALQQFKGLDLGEAGPWEMKMLDGNKPNEAYLPLLQKIRNPEAWISQFKNPDGSYNPMAMLEYEAYRQYSSTAASKRAEEARGEGANAVTNQVTNPGIPKPKDTPANAGPAGMDQVIRHLASNITRYGS